MLHLLKPYRVVIVDRDGDVFRHRAWTFADALTWAACYHGNVTITRTGRLVAARWEV